MKHLRTTSWLLGAGLALLLSGCHVILGPDEGAQDWWYYCDESGCYRCCADYCEVPDSWCAYDDECPGDLYCDPSSGSCRTREGCTMTADCATGHVCISGKCVPSRPPCTSNEACGDGAYCSNGSCEDSGLCTGDADCAKLGDSFVCDERGSCVPGEPKPEPCTSGDSCSGGLCVDGSCGQCSGDCGGGATCELDAHCGAGRVCLNGQCTSSCTSASDCATGQLCTGGVCVNDSTAECAKSADCGSGKVCVNQTCYEDCTASGICTSPLDICAGPVDLGTEQLSYCRPDHTAQLECKVNAECTGGELCVNGVCRTSCVTADDCAACEDGPVCGPGGFCMTAIEASPECVLSTDCDPGKSCLSGACVTL